LRIIQNKQLLPGIQKWLPGPFLDLSGQKSNPIAQSFSRRNTPVFIMNQKYCGLHYSKSFEKRKWPDVSAYGANWWYCISGFMQRMHQLEPLFCQTPIVKLVKRSRFRQFSLSKSEPNF